MQLEAEIRWPNNFSRMVGDKGFGLLLGHLLGLPVPRTLVVARRLAPFAFGYPTGTHETWIRTCPAEQVPGRFTTKHGWLDPFRLLSEEDPDGDQIVSVLAQEGVGALYSGAVAVASDGRRIIEGVRGFGADFMQGVAAPEELPDEVVRSVNELCEQAFDRLGTFRMEWAFDGKRTWVLQLHRGAIVSLDRTIYPGAAPGYRRFDVAWGIEALRDLIREIEDAGEGVVLVGSIGVTSHFGDLLRRAKIPSYLEDVQAPLQPHDDDATFATGQSPRPLAGPHAADAAPSPQGSGSSLAEDPGELRAAVEEEAAKVFAHE